MGLVGYQRGKGGYQTNLNQSWYFRKDQAWRAIEYYVATMQDNHTVEACSFPRVLGNDDGGNLSVRVQFIEKHH